MKLALPIVILLTTVLGCSEQTQQKEFTERKPIVVESVALGPGEWNAWPFTVTENGTRINGSYKTDDGVDHEIIFYVTDPASKDSLQAKNTGKYFFKSVDTRTQRHMSAVVRDLDPGDYFLLFHNESTSAAHRISVGMYLER